MTRPIVSIIIPVYNAEKYLHQCLDSVQNQTYTEWECLLIDDGSPDNCGIICDEYAAIDSRFRAIHKQNGGVSSARNIGLDNALGEWIAFIDSDDHLSPTYLESFLINPKIYDYDVLQGGHQEFGYYCTKNFIFENRIYMLDDVLSTTELMNQSKPGRIRICYPWGKLFRRSLIEKFNLRFNETIRLSEDFYFVLDYLTHAKILFEVNNNGYFYYRSDGFASKYMMNFDELYRHISVGTRSIEGFEKSHNIKLDNTKYSNLKNFIFCFIAYLDTIKYSDEFYAQVLAFNNSNYYWILRLATENYNFRSKYYHRLIIKFPYLHKLLSSILLIKK